jgi:dTDP-4-dehydrorhamnose reductase
MRILLAGAAGQLGQELSPLLERMGTVVRVDRAVPHRDEDMLARDLGEPGGVAALLDEIQPELIVNAAAYTAVDAAEEHRDRAFRLNGELPGQLAQWAAAKNAFLLHYSTDYVFPGDLDRPYVESDPVGPLNVYGESKLAGELAVTASGCRHLTVRTSWVWSGQGNNFVLTMLRLAAERSGLGIVDDQVGCPTWARNLATASVNMMRQAAAADGADLCGLYHYCDADAVSWFEFAGRVFAIAVDLGLLDAAPELTAVDSNGFPQKARRPAWSVLDASCAEKRFGIRRPGLDASLRTCLEEVRHARS